MTCRKYSEQENQDSAEQRFLKVEALFIGDVYKTGF